MPTRTQQPTLIDTTVRPITNRDHAAIHEILTSQFVIEGTMRVPNAPIHETGERLTPRPGTYHLAADVDGAAVGFAEIVTYPTEARHRHAAELNLIAVHPDWGGRGIGTRLMNAVIELADDWLNIRRLGLIVFVDNAHAIAMYEQFGFVHEGTLRDYGYKRGQYVDAHVMSRLRPT